MFTYIEKIGEVVNSHTSCTKEEVLLLIQVCVDCGGIYHVLDINGDIVGSVLYAL